MSPLERATLVAPHGGTLVTRVVADAEIHDLRARAASLPCIILDAHELADIELLATGAASPLTGFMELRDYTSVVERLRLADGTVWPMPVTLAVDVREVPKLARTGAAALYDVSGRLWAVIEISDGYVRNARAEAHAVYGTDDRAHPGVAWLLSRPTGTVAGEVKVLPLPPNLLVAERRLSPRALRARIAEMGWRTVAGFQTRNPMHRAHEYLTKIALEHVD